MPAVAETARWVIIILLLAILVVASISDIRDRRIPNWTVLAIALLSIPWAFFGASNGILSALGAALIAFSVSFPLYFFRVVGAGDSKLLTVVALFVGLNQLSQFLVLVVLAGGAIAVISLLMRPTEAVIMLQMRGKGVFSRGIPYGVAIAIAGAYVISWPLAHYAMA
jgi:prepilin peptidase CpaA